ncbi:hypothetical protein [Demetria terragena]|uniref:hypothetical protein n=1 Tax=Demetria terragena TaxID=63959 RepID=UPI0003741661|nr:hypothetical protein [Demetria terragena]
MLRTPLPQALPEPFTVAEARALGVSQGRTHARDLVAPFHGVRLPAGLVDDRLAQLRALQRVTPTAAFSHHTAGVLWHLPLPLHMERDRVVHQVVSSDRHRIEHRGVVGHVADRRIAHLPNGLSVTDLGDTWCDLAPALTLTQLVQAGDPILNRDG